MKGKDVYKANVAVTLAIVPSKLNSEDLVVYVYSGDTLVGSKCVTAEGLKENGGKVIIENVVLENGATVRFDLSGTQH